MALLRLLQSLRNFFISRFYSIDLISLILYTAALVVTGAAVNLLVLPWAQQEYNRIAEVIANTQTRVEELKEHQ